MNKFCRCSLGGSSFKRLFEQRSGIPRFSRTSVERNDFHKFLPFMAVTADSLFSPCRGNACSVTSDRAKRPVRPPIPAIRLQYILSTNRLAGQQASASQILFFQYAKLIADFLVYISKECVRSEEHTSELQ